jgi:putative hydrolase of the HAD superfamily
LPQHYLEEKAGVFLMITTVLFDVDGVLLVGEPWHKDLASVYSITDEMLAAFFRDSFQACLVGKADLKEALAPYLPRWGWPHSIEDFIDYWFSHHTVHEELLHSIQQLRQRGLKCYLATQQERYRTNYILHDLGFTHLFDGVFSSVNIGYMKSNPLFFETVLREIGTCQPEDVLFWDDSAGNVATARSLGIQAEVYRNFASFALTIHEYTG